MNLRDLLFGDLDLELAATRKTLERYPDGKGDWRPHQKSHTLENLARHVADLPGFASMMLEGEGIDVMTVRPPRSTASTAAELLANFDERARRLREGIAALSDAALESPWKLMAGAHVFAEAPRAVMIRRMGLTHIAHHRAQLGVYYRMLDVPVPGLFGPSADER
jgi:uncharacterized damage-inducible protein DinB